MAPFPAPHSAVIVTAGDVFRPGSARLVIIDGKYAVGTRVEAFAHTRRNQYMKRRTKIAVVVAAIVGVGVTEATIALGSDDAENERPITGSALQQASAAALAHTGGGEVADTEADDEESAYEVEVRRADGSTVDVQLDENFQVVGQEAESGSDDENSPNDN
jgi:uncharacterized membrane protein YkoI